MLDLLIKNANLPDGRAGIDIGIQGGHISDVLRTDYGADARHDRPAGQLVSPPFVDAHFHMDATLSYGLPRVNQSGTLLEGIALWGELKPQLTLEAIVERALAYCDWAVAKGLLAIRTHVDVCDPRLLAVDALPRRQEARGSVSDLQLVAFPQDGVLPIAGRAGQSQASARQRRRGGGRHPALRAHHGRRRGKRAHLVRAGAQRGLRVDMHCDETDDPMSRHIETLARRRVRVGLQGRVNGSHLTSMHSMDNYYVSKLIPLMAEAQVSAVANPLINITIQGRHDTYPKRRGMTRVPELMAAGIPVAFGTTA
jgi:cytosine deaminase